MIKPDERIQSSLRSICAQGFAIWWVLINAAILYRQIYLKQSPDQYWDLAAIFVIGVAYVTISMFSRGAVQKDILKIVVIFLVPFLTALSVALNYFQGDITSVKELAVTIISAAVGTCIGVGILYVLYKTLYKRWESKI